MPPLSQVEAAIQEGVLEVSLSSISFTVSVSVIVSLLIEGDRELSDRMAANSCMQRESWCRAHGSQGK